MIRLLKSALIVDDSKFMRLMIKNILIQNRFETIEEAENGLIAVEKYKNLKPDIVLMDIVMPEKTGIEALKEIIEFDPDAKVIMCSALSQEGNLVKAIELGAKEYIIKPFKADRMIETIIMVSES